MAYETHPQISRDSEGDRSIYRLIPDTQMEVEVILASASELAPNIYTIRMRYPRIIHSELMTHRVFSRNARSSRAVPVKRMLEEIQIDPFIPWHWGRNRPGMQASEENDSYVMLPDYNDVDFHGNPAIDPVTREEAWRSAADEAVTHAKAFHEAGYHKQVVNRLLEPFMYIDTLVTSTEWENFLWLRDHEDAEPHLRDLARMVNIAIQEAKPKTLRTGNWHLPYTTDDDLSWAVETHPTNWDAVIDLLCRVSAARCARISYAPFDGDASYERELERYQSLIDSDRVHASPLEHQATPDNYDRDYPNTKTWTHSDFHGNFYGWVQFRKLVRGENHAPTTKYYMERE